MTLLLQILFGLTLTFLIGFIQLKTAEFTLKRTEFFNCRYRDQCDTILLKVMFLVVAPLTILIEISLSIFSGWNSSAFFSGMGLSTISFFIILVAVYGRNIENRFESHHVQRDGKTLITSDVISKPTEAEVDILASGKAIRSRDFH